MPTELAESQKCPVVILQPALTANVDIQLIEGVGGWMVPLNSIETMADVAIALEAEVILVVAMRLGCLNHALLTCRAIEQSDLVFKGWIANCIDPDMIALQDNIETLKQLVPTTFIGKMGYLGA